MYRKKPLSLQLHYMANRMRNPLYGIVIVGLLALFSCRKEASLSGKEVIAEVNGKKLLQSQLMEALPEGLSKKDSTAFARSFIENWATDALMLEVAKENVPDPQLIDKMVEEYRNQLTMSEYQRYLLEEKLPKEITDEEVEGYYKLFGNELILNNNIIKGVYLKLPLKSPGLPQVRGWLSLKKDDYIEKIEKYVIQRAVDYKYFAGKWTDFDEVMSHIPYRISNKPAFLRQNRMLEIRDSQYVYMLGIKEFAVSGSRYPVDYAKEEIQNRLILQRKAEYINRFRKQLLRKGLEKNEVILKK